MAGSLFGGELFGGCGACRVESELKLVIPLKFVNPFHCLAGIGAILTNKMLFLRVFGRV